MTLYLISYDVVHDTRRRRVEQALRDYGRRVQYSVFECKLAAVEAEELWKRLESEIDETEDSVRRYRVCGACEKEVAILCKGERYEEPPFVVV